ncbi:MAG: SDR family oxidoreductase [Proteobacteria bacterium]|nr:SDR family oxidoreductase [Pseudomonadota bacterium]
MSQRVMITAAATGIGRCIARTFHENGAKVHVCDVNEEALENFREEFPEIGATHVNVRSEAEVEAWFDEALDDLGGLDVMVNNAGIKGPTAQVDDIDYADWKECLEVGIDSYFFCARRTAPILKDQRGGTIINLSSTAGLFGFGNRTPYAVVKWGVIGFTKSLAIELGPFSATCNAICPGVVKGDRINRVIQGEADLRGVPFETVAAQMVGGQSIPRFVEPQEIADMAFFLASPAAKMVNGQAIAVDGHSETFHIR